MGRKSVRRTQEEFIKDVNIAVGDEYTVIGNYINTDTKVKLRHNICQNEFEVRPYLFLGKLSTRCPYCNGKRRRTTEEFTKLVEEISSGEYVNLGTYKNTDTCILLHHKKCDKDFLMRPACFLKGQRCPHCERSKGAERIENYLTKKSVSYSREKKYEDLQDISYLKFDFFLEDLGVLIEYDGEQHFRVKSFGANNVKAIAEFNTLKRHDQMKNDYCSNKNIILLRIPYWKFNEIENILDKFIELLKVSKSNTVILNKFINDVFSKKF